MSKVSVKLTTTNNLLSVDKSEQEDICILIDADVCNIWTSEWCDDTAEAIFVARADLLGTFTDIRWSVDGVVKQNLPFTPIEVDVKYNSGPNTIDFFDDVASESGVVTVDGEVVVYANYDPNTKTADIAARNYNGTPNGLVDGSFVAGEITFDYFAHSPGAGAGSISVDFDGTKASGNTTNIVSTIDRITAANHIATTTGFLPDLINVPARCRGCAQADVTVELVIHLDGVPIDIGADANITNFSWDKTENSVTTPNFGGATHQQAYTFLPDPPGSDTGTDDLVVNYDLDGNTIDLGTRKTYIQDIDLGFTIPKLKYTYKGLTVDGDDHDFGFFELTEVLPAGTKVHWKITPYHTVSPFLSSRAGELAQLEPLPSSKYVPRFSQGTVKYPDGTTPLTTGIKNTHHRNIDNLNEITILDAPGAVIPPEQFIQFGVTPLIGPLISITATSFPVTIGSPAGAPAGYDWYSADVSDAGLIPDPDFDPKGTMPPTLAVWHPSDLPPFMVLLMDRDTVAGTVKIGRLSTMTDPEFSLNINDYLEPAIVYDNIYAQKNWERVNAIGGTGSYTVRRQTVFPPFYIKDSGIDFPISVGEYFGDLSVSVGSGGERPVVEIDGAGLYTNEKVNTIRLFEQRVEIRLEDDLNGLFQENEKVLGLSSNAYAYIVTNRTHLSSPEIFVESAVGDFIVGETLQGQTSGAEATIDTISSGYDKRYTAIASSDPFLNITGADTPAAVIDGTLVDKMITSSPLSVMPKQPTIITKVVDRDVFLEVDTVAGFLIGETIDDGGTTATITDIDITNNFLYVKDQVGPDYLPAAGITGATSGAAATISVVRDIDATKMSLLSFNALEPNVFPETTPIAITQQLEVSCSIEVNDCVVDLEPYSLTGLFLDGVPAFFGRSPSNLYAANLIANGAALDESDILIRFEGEPYPGDETETYTTPSAT